MKKLLFISNIAGKKISNFSIASIYASKELGYKFHFAANLNKSTLKQIENDEKKYNIKIHHIDIKRNPFNIKNIKAYKQMLDLIEKEKFDVIYCNTPIGGILGRFCGKKARVPKIIYTAHGFHFYKGAPFINKTVFKWAEMLMAHYTDVIITINKEDYQAAQKFKLRNKGKVYYIPGVGINTEAYRVEDVDKKILRNSLGLTENDIVLIAMVDLISRKNYRSSIKSIAKANNEKLKFLICGEGPELCTLKNLVEKLNIQNQVYFLGFRSDIRNLLAISDIFLFTTYQEGLPRSLMEAMAAGLPCVVSKIRGNVDLIQNGEGGYLCKPDDIDGFAKAINILAKDRNLRESMGRINQEKIKKFDIQNVVKEMKKIYERELLKIVT